MMDEALKLAVDDFKKIDLQTLPEKSGASLRTINCAETIALTYLNREYLILLPEVEITYASSPSAKERQSEGKEEVPLKEKIILVHYLNLSALSCPRLRSPGGGVGDGQGSGQDKSKGVPFPGKWIDFREVPEGNNYYSVFEGRIHKYFLKVFGEKPHTFLEAAQSLGGEKADFSEFSAIIPVLPRVSAALILYESDEEFPPSCKVLFNPSVKDYLSTEDLVIVCEDLVKELKRETTRNSSCAP